MPKAHTKTRISSKVGKQPGSIDFIGTHTNKKVVIKIIDFNETEFEERPLDQAEECFMYKDKKSVTWIDVEGVHDTKTIEKIATHFGLHPLVMEDIANTQQRPKMEEFDDYIFVVIKMLRYNQTKQLIEAEHLSIVMGNNFVITFQEGLEGDVFDGIRERLRQGKGRTRKSGSDFLVYSMLDMVTDSYFVILESLGDKIEDLENEAILKPEASVVGGIYRMKREMMLMRKAVWPVREIINSISHSENNLIQKSTQIYLRDVYDHTIQIIDTIELYRDMLAGMLDIYLSSISYKMNSVMKVLTIIATIFIPLTFVTSIYGMNFEFMPELKWKYGYLMVWGIMLTGIGFMLYYFKKKQWF
jgi:magnesium transporter